LDNLARILVAVDGSECSDRAFKAGLNLAKKFDSTLYALAVVDLPSILGLDRDNAQKLEASLQYRAKLMLSDYYKEAKRKGMEIETILARGYPSKAIVDIAKTKDIGLIVIGTRGLSGIKGLFLGSVSSDVVRRARQPVLVIR
jgi:nucleotide-binding universal stress UspA family protein